MKRVLIPVFAALALATPSLAQQQPDNSRPAMLNPGGPTNQEKSGTTPTGNGATGWGGTDQEKPKTGTSNPSATGSDLASGKDLKGPPQHLEGGATPE